MRALRKSNPAHRCALCGHRGNIAHHIRWQHPNLSYRQYVETYYKKFCRVCGKQIPYEPQRAQYSTVTCCSNECALKSQSKTLSGRRGKRAGSWRGGRFTAAGYVMLNIWGLSGPDRRLAQQMQRGRKDHVGMNYIQEHRLVMARKLGRPLVRAEVVHHRNANRADNRPANLELFVTTHTRGATARVLLCPHCGKGYA